MILKDNHIEDGKRGQRKDRELCYRFNRGKCSLIINASLTTNVEYVENVDMECITVER